MKLPRLRFSNPLRTPFRSRNPVVVGLVGGLVLVLVGLLVFYWDQLPVLGGPSYTADFKEAAGLKPQDEVRVAGVKVGEVTGVTLERDHVKVTFRARDVWLGNRTVAAVRIKTLLGQKNLALDPAGDAPLDPNTPIPPERTVTPYDVTDAFGDLAKTTGDIDTNQLAQSFSTLAEVFSSTTPQDIKSTLDGLAALSKTISSRDQELRTLLHNTGAISRTVADHNDQFAALIKDGGALLAEFTSRRDAVNRLLAGTRDLSHQLAGIVADNKDTLGPALDQLNHVTDVLQRNQDNLNRSLQLAGPFYRLVGNAVGNGRWIDTYICGLVPSNQPGCLPPKIGGN